MRSMRVEVSLVASVRMQCRLKFALAIIRPLPGSVHCLFAPALGEEFAIEPDVILRHARGRKTLLEAAANGAAIERNHVGQRLHGLLDIVYDAAGDAVV